jgi:tetratricopeptide (TPR) repeat protein
MTDTVVTIVHSDEATPAKDPYKVIVLLMIKNESRIIRRSIQAALKIADAICISDTGSTDDTVQLLADYYPSLSIPAKTYQHQWTNFGQNRSLSFEDAKAFCQELKWDPSRTYALAIDADMEFVVEPAFDKQKDFGAKGYSLTQKAGSLHYINARLLRLDQPFKCVGATHEYWDGPNDGAPIPDTKLWINDKNDGGCKADKFTRDLKMLQEELKEQPTNVRTHFYLAQTFKCLGQKEESIEMYKRRIALGGWFEEVWYSHYMIGQLYLDLKKVEEAEFWILKGQAFNNYRAEGLYQLVKHFRIVGQQWKAMHYYLEAKKIRKPQIALFQESEVYDHLLDYEYTVLQYYVNAADRREGLRSCVKYLQNPQSTGFLENVFSNIEFYVQPLLKDPGTLLPLPKQGDYHPSSCSITKHNGTLVLNARYVNYATSDQGAYTVRTSDSVVRTKNAFLPAVPGAYPPIESLPYVQEDEALVEFQTNIMGLEDVRIVSHKGTLFYTAASKSCNINKQYRIVLGSYGSKLSGSRVLESPSHSECEKNWLAVPDLDLTSDYPLFIHKWHPFEVGKVDGSKLNITTRFQTSPYFSKLRGSANAVKVKDEFWCLTHVVKYGTPRKYYHHIVVLDGATLKPIRLSMPFYFKTHGIEYCLGFHVDGDQVQFIYSTFDSSPRSVTVPVSQFEFLSV